MANMAAVEISRIDIKTMLLKRENEVLPYNYRQFCHPVSAFSPHAIVSCPTDNRAAAISPHQCRRGDNFGQTLMWKFLS